MAKVQSYCRFCGAKVEPDSRFCSYCGKPISSATGTTPSPPTPTVPTPAPPTAATAPTLPKAPTSPTAARTPTPTAPRAATPPTPSTVDGSRGKSPKKKRSKKKIAAIVILVIVGVFGALIAIGSSLNSTPSTFTRAGAPSDQEIETQIAQASADPEMDRVWNKLLNDCMDWNLRGNNLNEVQCDGATMTADRDNDCQLWNGELLLCNQNSGLGKKFQSYLNIIG